MSALRRNILLNPGPATTSQTVKDAQVVADICPRETEFGDLLQGIRRDLSRVVHGDSTHTTVLFGGSGTAAMEAAMSSLPAPDGKILIIENGSYGARFRQIAEVYDIDVVPLQLAHGDVPDPARVKELLAANGDVKMVFVVHHETSTGVLNPIQELARVAREHGARIVVDAMSSYAGLPIDVNAMGIDAIIASSNKCIQGMAGLSWVILANDLLAMGNPKRRSYYLDVFAQHATFEKTGQMQFTPPVQTCYALRQAIDEYFAETEAGRFQRYAGNMAVLRAGLVKIGFRLYKPDMPQSDILLTVYDPTDTAYSFDALHDALYADGFTIYPGKVGDAGTFRLAVLGDLYEDDIRAFLSALENFANAARINEF